MASTCFFQLHLPAYTSFELLDVRMRYAINNCVAIDTDNQASTSSVFEED